MKNDYKFNKVVKDILDKRPLEEIMGIGLIYDDKVHFKPKPASSTNPISWINQTFHIDYWPRHICNFATRFRSYGYDNKTNTITISWTDHPSKEYEFMVEDYFNKRIPNAKFKHEFWWDSKSKTSFR